MDNGFDFSELSDFKKDCLQDMINLYPEEAKKFVKKEATKLANVAKKVAKRDVGSTGKHGDKSYHKRFKAGKPYKYICADICCRAYNSSPVGHLIENGHEVIIKGRQFGFAPGKNVFKKAETEFKNEFLDNTDEFLDKYFDGILDK